MLIRGAAFFTILISIAVYMCQTDADGGLQPHSNRTLTAVLSDPVNAATTLFDTAHSVAGALRGALPPVSVVSRAAAPAAAAGQ